MSDSTADDGLIDRAKLRHMLADIDSELAAVATKRALMPWMLAEIERPQHGLRLAPWQVGAALLAGGAAFFAARAALVEPLQ